MILQLDPPLPMDTARGAGLAHFMIDYGPESHLMWVVFMDADGACWTVPNPEVRMQSNWSLQRRPSQKPFQRPAPIVVPPGTGLDGRLAPEVLRAADAGAQDAQTPNGGGTNGAALNGRGTNGSATTGPRRYDASPAGD